MGGLVSKVSYSRPSLMIIVKAVVGAFNQEKALGAFSVITNLRMDLFEALLEGAPVSISVDTLLLAGAGGRRWKPRELRAGR